jgi:hypothetical protein
MSSTMDSYHLRLNNFSFVSKLIKVLQRLHLTFFFKKKNSMAVVKKTLLLLLALEWTLVKMNSRLSHYLYFLLLCSLWGEETPVSVVNRDLRQFGVLPATSEGP